ncbi:MAG: hypothetical protein HKN74_07120 [Acidimicrobiia bacterium]|nr:hypothetical protein [Acidimicrobiia bacterium]
MESELTARGALLSGLIDYAGLFPPESRDMRGAVAGYSDARALQSWMVHRFIVPEGRLEELAEHLEDEPDPWPLAVVFGEPYGEWSKSIADDARSLEVVKLAMRDSAKFEIAELKLPPSLAGDPAASAKVASVRSSLAPLFDTVLFEVSLADERTLGHQLQIVFEAGAGAKIRCGGAAVEDFPSPATVAEFISTSAELEIPFKATAGLHHPLRHWDCDPGVKRHGFLNIVGASVLAAVTDIGVAELTEVIAEEDPDAFEVTDLAFRWRHRAATAGEVAKARDGFMLGYGSCSFTEPVADLVEMGIL